MRSATQQLEASRDTSSGAIPRGDGRSLGDVVFAFCHVTWDDAVNREFIHAPDRLARSLACHERVSRLLIADPFRSLPVRAARVAMGGRRAVSPEGIPHCRPWRAVPQDPSRVAGAQRTYRRYDRRIRRAAQTAGLDEPTVITTNPLLAGFAPLQWARSITYYAIDDWPEHPRYARWRDVYLEAYRRLAADPRRRVCAVSSHLLERIDPSGPGCVVPNGIDSAEWSTPGAVPDWFDRLPSPRLIYVGALDSRLDLEALLAIADANPLGTVAVVGSSADQRLLDPLLSRPNIRLHDSVARGELTGIVSAADVGLVPHIRSDLTAAMSPLKLYEYLAGGLPVAAIDLPPIRGVHPRVFLAGEGSQLPSAVEQALDAGRAPESQRLEFLEANAWRRRHDQIIDFALR